MKLSPVMEVSSAEAEALVAAFCTPDDRQQAAKPVRLLARALTRQLLWEATGSRAWRLQPDGRGKPYAMGAQGEAGPFISFAHTGRFAVAVLDAASPVGVDIEQWRARNFQALAAYAFGPNECASVAHEGAAAFYRIWCLREAMAKASGDGVLAQITGADYPPEGWQLHYLATGHYGLATARRA